MKQHPPKCKHCYRPIVWRDGKWKHTDGSGRYCVGRVTAAAPFATSPHSEHGEQLRLDVTRPRAE